MSGHILIIDDEPELARALAYSLDREGFHSEIATTGHEGLELAQRAPRPDLVLLDLMLPDMSGNDVCRALRASPDTRALPVVMLTAKDDEIDRVVGFEVGADDYVTKPFSNRELLLRVKAVLRRSHQHTAAPSRDVTSFGCLRVDEAAHQVQVDGRDIPLTVLEFRLLTTLMARRGRVQTRDTLLQDVWGVDGSITTRTVDTHVQRLRKKLLRAGAYIETLRGVGYRFASSPHLADP